MPRGKLQLKLIENPTKRRSTYRKRIKGLKQKAYELSTLCGVEAFAISYSPSGDAETWPENRQEVEATFARYTGLGAGARARDRPENAPTAEALDLQLGKVRQRISLLRSRTDLDVDCEDIFSWLDYEEVGMASDESYLDFLNSCDNLEEASIEPYMELTDSISLTPTDAGFPQLLAPEPCLDVSDHPLGVVSDRYDRFWTPFGLNPFESFDDNWAGSDWLIDAMGFDDRKDVSNRP